MKTEQQEHAEWLEARKLFRRLYPRTMEVSTNTSRFTDPQGNPTNYFCYEHENYQDTILNVPHSYERIFFQEDGKESELILEMHYSRPFPEGGETDYFIQEGLLKKLQEELKQRKTLAKRTRAPEEGDKPLQSQGGRKR